MLTETINKHYLFPSTLFAERDAHVIDTILGSCVAVCLFDTKLKIGGMNHYMLPLWNGEGLASPKFGNIANEKLVEKMIRMGSHPQNLVAKLFGGANQINSSINIGDRNIQIAKEQLHAFGIKTIKESLGGSIGRKIRFNSSTGEVLMKFLTKP
ncbi:chemotaxis protein CheD [Aurantibacillus circumpalustris]|uniref:chemotaxis protein CheD n=1 Tax=Aurantibacillus circumpalustris TaxID=3036359 RepID=UPI00295AE05B|nr:chemotaxis protein CheD [Aurantibacillus circumpalustris]